MKSTVLTCKGFWKLMTMSSHYAGSVWESEWLGSIRIPEMLILAKPRMPSPTRRTRYSFLPDSSPIRSLDIKLLSIAINRS